VLTRKTVERYHRSRMSTYEVFAAKEARKAAFGPSPLIPYR
jgi:hypothetical protein